MHIALPAMSSTESITETDISYGGGGGGDVDGSSEQQQEQRQQQQHPQLQRRVRLRFQAAKLPRVKRRTTAPSTLILVTSKPTIPSDTAFTGLDGDGDDDDDSRDESNNNATAHSSTSRTPMTDPHYKNSTPVLRDDNDNNNNSTGSSLDHAASSLTTTSLIWGRTELVEKSRNPQWAQTIEVNYTLGTELYFYAKVMLWDSVHKQFKNCLGSALFEINSILTSSGKTIVKRLRQGGFIYCQVDLVSDNKESKQQLRFHILATTALQIPRPSSSSVSSLVSRSSQLLRPKLGGRGSGDSSPLQSRVSFNTILELTRQPWGVGQPNWVTIWRSLPVLDSLHPIWERGEIDLDSLCQGSLDQPIRITVLISPNRQMIGFSETTVRNLLLAASSNTTDAGLGTFALQRDDKDIAEVGRLKVCLAELFYPETQHEEMDRNWEAIRPRTGSTSSEKEESDISTFGMVDFSSVSPVLLPNVTHSTTTTTSTLFRSYVHEKGCDINLAVAIDFTSSNGDPRNESSHHYQCPDDFNDYEETIQMIGSNIAAYNKTAQYTVWGFGAKFDGVCRHLFQCGPNRYVTSVDEILMAYRSMFQSDLIMSGPTIVSQVLQAAAAIAKRYHDTMTPNSSKYLVLLVITDGVMDDWDETQRKLAVYSPLPMSIVFVGIGRTSFDEMNRLGYRDNNNNITNNNNPTSARQQLRPNTTFVEFRTHQYNPIAFNQAALQYIPDQLCSYMKSRNL